MKNACAGSPISYMGMTVLGLLFPLIVGAQPSSVQSLNPTEDVQNKAEFSCWIRKSDVAITNYVGHGENVDIPATLDGRKVKMVSGFLGNKTVKSVLISEGVEVINVYAFCGCESLSSVTLPQSVTDIYGYAFAKCASLSSINLPINLVNVYNAAFRDCTSLTTIVIPQRLKRIPTAMFQGCTSLESIFIPSSVTNVGARAFADCSALKTVYTDEGNMDRICSLLKQSGFECTNVQVVPAHAASSEPVVQE